eukprot:CAMPEP_0113939856 /NCGR_PEP_ID=MMETSP1339-20121228/6098_1 /TAXON_ID=94617 /ORGANISM="Fibrocapsa japonica" /LENGTH=118 /DNA_ID=CAMNT_0000943481 /DNA_START=19 /DNA_END=375 /DNA_ORIENTATION=- /assembly_acc=CAM_ASM_000762
MSQIEGQTPRRVKRNIAFEFEDANASQSTPVPVREERPRFLNEASDAQSLLLSELKESLAGIELSLNVDKWVHEYATVAPGSSSAMNVVPSRGRGLFDVAIGVGGEEGFVPGMPDTYL